MKTTTMSKILLTVLILVPMAGSFWLLLLGGLWRLTGAIVLLGGIAFLVWLWWPRKDKA